MILTIIQQKIHDDFLRNSSIRASLTRWGGQSQLLEGRGGGLKCFKRLLMTPNAPGPIHSLTHAVTWPLACPDADDFRLDYLQAVVV